MQSYLEENVRENQKHERIRLRTMKAVESRRRNLEATARKITVQPSTGSEQAETSASDVRQQQQKSWKCKKVETEKTKVIACNKLTVEEEPVEGSLVIEQRKGIWVVCHNCGHRFVHHSKNLSKQYYCTCSRCKSNIRLKHYK